MYQDDELTAEELAAINDETIDAAPSDETVTDDETTDEVEATQEDEKPADEVADEKPAAEPESNEEITGPEGDKAAPTEKPVYDYKADDDSTAKLEEIKNQKAELRAKYDDGDITMDEYEAQRDELNDQATAIRESLLKESIAQEMNLTQQRNAFLAEVERFTGDDFPEYRTSKIAWGALDAAVKDVAKDPDNAALSAREVLEKAHGMVKADLGDGFFKGKQPATEPDKDTGKTKPVDYKKPDLPPSISKLPKSDNVDTDGGRWATLDRLAESDPMKYEQALEKLSKADREAYLSA